MNTTPQKRLDDGQVSEQMASLMYKVRDAIRRAEDNILDGVVTPQACAYIDGQCYKAIMWLASVRALAVTHGQLDQPHFDTGDLVDLDDPRGLVERFEDATEGKAVSS